MTYTSSLKPTPAWRVLAYKQLKHASTNLNPAPQAPYPEARNAQTKHLLKSADLGEGGGRGGIPASFPSRSPPPKQPFQPTPTPSARRFAKNRNLRGLGGFCGKRPQAPGGPGSKPWGPGPQAPWRPGPQAPGGWIRHSHRFNE